MPLPKPKYAHVDPTHPEGWGQCDRCSFWYDRSELRYEMQWGGAQLYNTEVIVCPRCHDIPFEQLRTIILPPDPPPVRNARPPNFAVEEFTNIQFQFGGPGLPPWGAGPQIEILTQDRTRFVCFQYNTTTATQIS